MVETLYVLIFCSFIAAIISIDVIRFIFESPSPKHSYNTTPHVLINLLGKRIYIM